MAAYDVERQNTLNWFRTDVSPAQIARERQEVEFQRQREAQDAMTGFIALLVVALVAVCVVVVNRRKIARAADAALVTGLASGVRAGRAATSRKNAFFSRVIAKADADSQPKP